MSAHARRVDGRDAALRIGLGAIIAYVVLACGLAWLVALPLWLGEGLAAPFAPVLLPVMMYTPAVAVLIVMLVMRPVPRGQRLRFLGMWPLRPASRVIWMSVISLFGTVAVVVLAMLIAIAFGWMKADFIGLSGFEETLRGAVPPGTELPPAFVLVAAQLASLPVAAATVNALAAFGEELGWRGFLVPALRRYGTWTALLVSGAIWGLWHAPVILLGYNFGRTDILGVLLMVGGCVAVGVLFGWTRLRSGSVWPAVFAHGALNAAAGLPMVFRAAGTPLDPAFSIVLGISGWIACAIVIVILLLTGQFREQPALARRGPGSAPQAPLPPAS
ncbi:CPBP family intramembrane metalloprotease [Microbacterium bovistercoris]|uniref:CPBP family intramembrane metalloprotease n=1 Tax=Microbacterium bovistercoris TaxID=2293570 RepID=A0A371NY56_9MICO|nr:CPBP family intramembrane glutamic endopeptidase [Microbacterium bovistercoris]REJ08198.1 CPBP family intramembrane metalloprotease [Microbacterium bovistercoris]